MEAREYWKRVALNLGSITALSSGQVDFSARLRVTTSSSQSSSDTSGSSTQNNDAATYSATALYSTNKSLSNKANVINSQLEETNRLLDIAAKIKANPIGAQTANLRSDAQARITAAATAYNNALAADTNIDETDQQRVDTSLPPDTESSDDAVILDIRSVDSLAQLGITAATFDSSTNSIDETINDLENVRDSLLLSASVFQSSGTAVSQGINRAGIRATVLSQTEENPVDSDSALKEASSAILDRNNISGFEGTPVDLSGLIEDTSTLEEESE